MGVGKRILHPWRPKTASYGLTRRQKKPKHPKTLLNHSARNGFWTPQVAARRSNTAPRPIRSTPTVGAPSGACGRTAYIVIPPPPWHLGPDCGAFWPRASILSIKFGSQSNQALVAAPPPHAGAAEQPRPTSRAELWPPPGGVRGSGVENSAKKRLNRSPTADLY